jgi:hypothetical protein
MKGEDASIQAFEGRGDTIEDAVKDAWYKATAKLGEAKEKRTLRVVEISVSGKNPISGYGVVLVGP